MHKPARNRMLTLMQRAATFRALPFRHVTPQGHGQGGVSKPPSLVRCLAGAWMQRRLARHPGRERL